VLAAFDCGAGCPAELLFRTGKGELLVLVYHPRLSYFHPTTLQRPVDRCPHPDSVRAAQGG
jgi:hypothetical protein